MYVRNLGSNTNKRQGRFIEYLQMKQARNNFTFTISFTGESYYTVNGKKMSEKDFNKLYPIGSIDSGAIRLDSRQYYY